MITIGEHKLPTSRPSNLDAALIETTGCSAAEHAAMRRSGGTAFQVAQALHPLLGKDAPDVGELASMIGEDDLLAARRAVADLLDAPAEKAA